MVERIHLRSAGKTTRNVFLVLVLGLPAVIALGCKEDPPAPAASRPVRPPFDGPINLKNIKPIKEQDVMAAASASASAEASASTNPPASAAASAEASKPGANGTAAAASTKAETPKKEPIKPATSASAAAPILSASAIAAPTTPQSPADLVAAQVDQIFLGQKTFSAKFKQEHTQKIAGVTKKSTGSFFFERPNKMSFRYDPPSQNRIVSDGQTMKVYIADVRPIGGKNGISWRLRLLDG
jgi:Outer membrane lipoprotein carrier protein LolA